MQEDADINARYLLRKARATGRQEDRDALADYRMLRDQARQEEGVSEMGELALEIKSVRANLAMEDFTYPERQRLLSVENRLWELDRAAYIRKHRAKERDG